MSILSRAAAEVVEYVRIHTPSLTPPRLNQLLAGTKDRRRVSHRIKGSRNASAGSIPRDDRALTEERL